MLKFPAPFQQAVGKTGPVSAPSGHRWFWQVSAQRAKVLELEVPTATSPPLSQSFACGFQANVSHLERSSVRALLTVRSPLEAYTGCGGDTEDGLLIALKAPSSSPPGPPPQKKDAMSEDGLNQAAIPLPVCLGLWFPSPRLVGLAWDKL